MPILYEVEIPLFAHQWLQGTINPQGTTSKHWHIVRRTWGEIVSSISDAIGTPMCVKSQNNFREIRNPLLILKDPSISGSLIRPFQPTVVLYLSEQRLKWERLVFQDMFSLLWGDLCRVLQRGTSIAEHIRLLWLGRELNMVLP